MLQAQQRKAPYSFIESAKLHKAIGDPLRALNELEASSKLLGLFDDQVLDLTADVESERLKAKVTSSTPFLAYIHLLPDSNTEGTLDERL